MSRAPITKTRSFDALKKFDDPVSQYQRQGIHSSFTNQHKVENLSNIFRSIVGGNFVYQF